MIIGTTINNINWWLMKHLQLYFYEDSINHEIRYMVSDMITNYSKLPDPISVALHI